jgi:hypothetical protein
MISGKILYSFRWFWRQDISTQIQIPAQYGIPPPNPKPASMPLKKSAGKK